MVGSVSDSQGDVICVGLVVADHVCAPISRFPPAGELVTTRSLTLTIGGCAANVAVDLAKLGVSASLVGKVGDDVFGQYVRDELERCGVNCRGMSISPTTQTSGTMVVNVQGEDRRFIHAVGANAELTGGEVTDGDLAAAKILYVGGFGLNAALSGENVAQLFQRARKHGVRTVLDVVVDHPKMVSEMLPAPLQHTDLFLPNTDEARMLSGLAAPNEQAEHFLKMGARTVIITQGPGGALLQEQGRPPVRISSHAVEQVDGTGGGDAFVAGYLYGLLKEASVEECLNYGAASGASCVQIAGATTGVLRAPELEAFVAEHRLGVT
ncbi:MAG: carbohydrate kinase family protein [Planctomycetaceae bacterium]|nr:carbohydrate kinase family protein [Planctomycetaceae bacterium]